MLNTLSAIDCKNRYDRKNKCWGTTSFYVPFFFSLQKMPETKSNVEKTHDVTTRGQYCVSYKSEQRQSMRVGSSLFFLPFGKTKTTLSCRTCPVISADQD